MLRSRKEYYPMSKYEYNRRSITQMIMEEGIGSFAEMARELRISKDTVARIVKYDLPLEVYERYEELNAAM